jgi:RNA polymerase sigma-70 factor (ECF subfamily)
MSEGLELGLAMIEELGACGELNSYHLYHAARADLLRRMGRNPEAIESYRRALALASNAVELRYLGRRLSSLEGLA